MIKVYAKANRSEHFIILEMIKALFTAIPFSLLNFASFHLALWIII